MGPQKARRSLAAASRAGQAGRILICLTFFASNVIVILTIRPDNRCTDAKIHLGLIAWHTFHPAERYRLILSQAFDKSADTVVAALKSILVSEVLVDSLTGQPVFKFVFNNLAEGFTLTATGRCITSIYAA